MENGTEVNRGNAARKCGSSFCDNLLKKWDDHALCPSCRNCGITDNTCYICKDWSEEKKKKATEGMKPRIKVEPGSPVRKAPVFSIDDDDDDDDDDAIIFLDTKPNVDTNWIKKEKPDCRIRTSKIASNDSEVIMILSDDDESDEDAVIIENSTKETEPSKQTIDRGKLVKDAGSTSPTTPGSAQQIVRDKDPAAKSGSSGEHSVPQLPNGSPTSERLLEITEPKECLSGESSSSTKDAAKNEPTRKNQQLSTNSENHALRGEGIAESSKDKREVSGTDIDKSNHQSSPSPAVREQKSAPLNDKDVVVEPSVKTTCHANKQTNLSETSGSQQNPSIAPAVQEQKAKTKPIQVDEDVVMGVPSVKTATQATNEQVNKTNPSSGSNNNSSILPAAQEQNPLPKPTRVDEDLSMVDTPESPVDTITLSPEKKDNLPKPSGSNQIPSSSPAIQEKNVQSVPLHVDKNVLVDEPSNETTRHTPSKEGIQAGNENKKDVEMMETSDESTSREILMKKQTNQSADNEGERDSTSEVQRNENKKDLTSLSKDVKMMETSDEPRTRGISNKKQANNSADDEGERDSTSEVQRMNDNDEMAVETQKTSPLMTTHPKDVCSADDEEGAASIKGVQNAPLDPVEENNLPELPEDDYDSDGWEIDSEEGSASGEDVDGGLNLKDSGSAEVIPVAVTGAVAGAGNTLVEMAEVVPPEIFQPQDVQASPPAILRPLKIIPAAGSLTPDMIVPSVLFSSDVFEESIKLEQLANEVIKHDVKVSNAGGDAPPAQKQRRQTRARRKQRENTKQEDNLPDVVVNEHKAKIRVVKPVFNCHRCFESFKDKALLTHHLDNHPEVTRIMCVYCNRNFQKQRNLNTHLKRCYKRKKSLVKGRSPKKASSGRQSGHAGDNKSLYDRVKLKRFNQNGKIRQLFAEKILQKSKSQNKEKATKDQRQSDPRNKGQESPLSRNRCPVCKLMLASRSSMTTHMLRRHKVSIVDFKEPDDEELYWKCPVCYKSKYFSKEVIVRHLYRQHNVKADEEYPNLAPLPKEKAVQVIYGCQYCSEFFPSLGKFKQHTMDKGKAGVHCKKTYRCNLCLKNFPQISICTSHIREHLGIFKCSVRGCSETYPSEEAREKHERTHDDATEKKAPSPRKSPKAGGKEQSSSGRKSALRFKCKRCSKKFDREFLLAKHELEHTNSDPWHCYICFKIFYLNRSMVNHMETSHPGVEFCRKCYCILLGKLSRKRLCVDCDKKKDSSNLKCGQCKTEFDSVFDLAQHILNHSSDNSAPDIPFKPVTTRPGGSAVKAENVSPKSIVEGATGKRRVGRPCKSTGDKNKILPDSSPKQRRSSGDTNHEKQRSSLGKTMLRSGTCRSVEANHVIQDRQVLTRSLVKDHGVSLESGKAQSRKRPRSIDKVDTSESKLLKTSRPRSVDNVDTSESQFTSMKSPTKNTPLGSMSICEVSFTKSPGALKNKCLKCGKKDIPPHELTGHARTHLQSRSEYNCNGCSKFFADMDSMEVHLAVEHAGACSYVVGKLAYECRGCARMFLNIMEARKHVLSTNASCMLECGECGQEYTKQGDLMVHMIKVHHQYLECDQCLAQFTSQSDLQSHMQQHLS